MTRCETAARAYGKSTPGQMRADRALGVLLGEVADHEEAGLLHLDQEEVASPYLADTVTVSTTSRTSGPSERGTGLQVEIDLRVPGAVHARARWATRSEQSFR